MQKLKIIIGIASLFCIMGLSGNTAKWDKAQDETNASNLLVFPGAEGFGVYNQAGRGGTVYRVTHLGDRADQGSLRTACEASGPRTVIFEVSGTIEMTADINITNPYITIAGQTAPYPGIQLKGAGIRIAATHDVLIQHLRIRPGDKNPSRPDPSIRRALSISHSGSNIPYNIIIDHCSLQWGVDANANIFAKNAHDITYSNCIISEGLDDSIHPSGPHSMGLNIIHDDGGGHRNISVIKNLVAHSGDRNPQIGGNTHVQLVNNVMYNCRTYHIRITDSKSVGSHNTTIVGNHAIVGNDSLYGKDYVATIFDSVANGTRIYADDNMSNNYPGPTIQDLKGSGITWLSSPEVWADVEVIPTSNNQARNWVLNNAGAWPGHRDSVDTRVTDEVRNGTGRIIDSQSEVGGWPLYDENKHPLHILNNSDGDADGDGYTNLEEWIHAFTHCVEEGGITLISGTVTVNGSGFGDVVMNGLPGSPKTDASGNYIAEVALGWSGSVTPSKSSYTFTPKSRTYSNVRLPLTGEDYSDTQSYNLTISSVTGAPSLGQGGTTAPSPGIHPYSNGSAAYITSISETDYRFSNWTGDLENSDKFEKEITLTMDRNKSIQANFCTGCGDINGDVKLTPADAQIAFDLFLNKINNPTKCEIENADVNCDGTKSKPKITPADAQAIFEKYLGVSALPEDCSGISRSSSTEVLSLQKKKSGTANLIINSIRGDLDEDIFVPIIIESTHSIDAFGFDLLFPPGILEYVALDNAEISEKFEQVSANLIAEGVLRIGGYGRKAIMNRTSYVLIMLVFRIKGKTKDQTSFAITNTVDDIENASIRIERLIT